MTAGRCALAIATITVLALAAAMCAFHAIPMWVPLAAICLYMLLAFAGAVFPALQMYARVLAHGPRTKREVVLTFDDGPDPVTTRKVLDLLDQAGVVATFFVIGRKVEEQPGVVAEILERKHSIGLHTHQHDHWLALRHPRVIAADLVAGLDAAGRVVGQRPSWLRVPVGPISPRIALAARKLGLQLIGASARGYDGRKNASARAVLARIRRGLRPGALIALHDASESGGFEPCCVQILPDILSEIQSRGLKVVPLADWTSDFFAAR